VGQQIRNGFLEDTLAGQAVYLEFPRNAYGKFRQSVIEEWHTAFDRRSHAHVVLLHEQFDQISLDVGVKQTAQQVTGRVVPILHDVTIGGATTKFLHEFVRQQLCLVLLTERREEIVKIE